MTLLSSFTFWQNSTVMKLSGHDDKLPMPIYDHFAYCHKPDTYIFWTCEHFCNHWNKVIWSGETLPGWLVFLLLVCRIDIVTWLSQSKFIPMQPHAWDKSSCHVTAKTENLLIVYHICKKVGHFIHWQIGSRKLPLLYIDYGILQ